jgi:hypothetical protein
MKPSMSPIIAPYYALFGAMGAGHDDSRFFVVVQF